MSTHQSRRPAPGRTQRDEVEEILALVPGATAAEAEALIALFSSISGPVHTGELPGEAVATAAFAAAHPPAVPSRSAKFRATVFTVKTAAAALILTSMGGVALAATTEVLPAPLTIGSHADDPSPRETKAAEDGTNAAAVRDAAKAAATADRADEKAGRVASFARLCQAFTVGGGDNAKAAANPAFSRLVAAAPDGNVPAFCSALAAEALAAKTPATGKGKSAGENAADNGKSVAAREKAADRSKAAEAREKAAGKSKSAQARENAGDNANANPRGIG